MRVSNEAPETRLGGIVRVVGQGEPNLGMNERVPTRYLVRVRFSEEAWVAEAQRSLECSFLAGHCCVQACLDARGGSPSPPRARGGATLRPHFSPQPGGIARDGMTVCLEPGPNGALRATAPAKGSTHMELVGAVRSWHHPRFGADSPGQHVRKAPLPFGGTVKPVPRPPTCSRSD